MTPFLLLCTLRQSFGPRRPHCLTIRQRARALISIAHPAFREQLEAEAQRLEFF
ncbi:MAG TPA: acetyl-CoA hydrolase/transferase C-terminal domain-containing protein [Myxococcota bacterium]|nr:acetyl-CoA hydrolase/transferase C-terminal domain-containing protein [Myxococcota bacterium]